MEKIHQTKSALEYPMNSPKRILLCRTDSIGDVMVTLPLVGWIKSHWPEVKIDFAGKAYTQAVIEACPLVDGFVNADELLQWPQDQARAHLSERRYDAAIFAFPEPQWMQLVAAAKVPIRIATAGRWSAWRWANRRVWFSRKNSPLHEAQLNAFLIQPLGIEGIPSLDVLIQGIRFVPQVEFQHSDLLPQRPFAILHPKSKGSAVEWGVQAFMQLAVQLMDQGLEVVITGTAAEGEAIRREVPVWPAGLRDATGRLSLAELIALIAHAQALVAASTGPLHIAAALGIRTVGLYTPMRPMHPGRWAPLGHNTRVLVADAHPAPGQLLHIAVDAVRDAVIS